jgi:hypothetical protein
VFETREPELIPIRRIPGLGNAIEPLNRIIRVYAYEIGDRILHDRELCYFIAQTVMDIGFDGETVEGMRSQWVERERWPWRIKEILRARDRGKCAACGVDIVQELREEGHIGVTNCSMKDLRHTAQGAAALLQLLCEQASPFR